jgi:hypothetical protein
MKSFTLLTVALAFLFFSQVASAFPFGKGVLGTDIFGDSDQDLVSAAQEVIDETNPLVADTDGDGLLDGQEATNGTNPLLSDTDGDGFSDGDESDQGSDPLDAQSTPSSGLSLLLIKAAIDLKNNTAEKVTQ